MAEVADRRPGERRSRDVRDGRAVNGPRWLVFASIVAEAGKLDDSSRMTHGLHRKMGCACNLLAK